MTYLAPANPPEDDVLNVELTEDHLIIKIGTNCLRHGVEGLFDGGRLYDQKIVSYGELLEDTIAALMREDEDGSTYIHRAIDDAVIDAIENGSLGVEDRPREELE